MTLKTLTLLLAATAVRAAQLKAEPMTLQIFNQNFHANSFCEVFADIPDISKADRYVNLLTNEVVFTDNPEEQRTIFNKKGREVRFDASRSKDTCVGPNFQWREFITDEDEWEKLVQEELRRVTQVPTEQHSWIATVWPHVTVDHVYTTALSRHLELPHHLHEDEEGNLLTQVLHSAFGQYIRMNDDFGPIKNPGYFVLPLNARMAQLAQDQMLFEHLFPLPAIFKVHPSVRVFVHHAGRHKDVDTCGGEELDIHLTPVANEQNTNAVEIASEWNTKLDERQKNAGLRFFSTCSHMVTLEREDRGMHTPVHVSQVVEWLARDPRVADMELRPRFYAWNGYAASVTQVDPPPLVSTGVDGNGQPVYATVETLATPIFDKGIKGQGQVVGVGDSGLDYDSCFFYDAQVPINPGLIPQGPTAPPKNFPTHRKVVQYVGYADNISGEKGGHGSHVAASVAGKRGPGKTLGEQSKGQSFYDGAAPEAKVAFFDIGRPGERGLRVPQSLHTNFFPPSRQAGAFLHTNSWGSNANAYTSTARDSDLYQFENQDYLVLVAAGNSGDLGAGSVGTPAVAKNIIGVGASVASKGSWADLAVGVCAPVSGAGAKCTTRKKLENSIAGFSSSGPTFDGRQQPVIVAPGQNIVSADSNAVPGGQTCNIARKQGTSMATPITAGNAALVRQYFTDGFYPTGTKVPANSRRPTGALIKAAMVNGARVINNAEQIGQVLKRGNTPVSAISKGKPDTVQGHGLVTLTHSLMFPDSPKNFRTRVLAGFCPPGTCGRQDFLNLENVVNAAKKEYTVPVPPNAQLGVNVTLVWSDMPGAVNARGPAIVNNLDLKVLTSNGKTFLPSDPSTGQMGVITRDNTEKVVIAQTELTGVTSLTITVTGTSVPQGPQPFALIAGGAIGAAVTTPPPLPDDPPGKVVIDAVEGSVDSSNGGASGGTSGGGGGGADNGISLVQRFLQKTTSTFGIIVTAILAALVAVIVLIILMKIFGCWCCLASRCALVFVLILRAIALVGVITAFVFVATEQQNIEKALQQDVKFGSLWQQILMVVALSLTIIMLFVGTLLGVVQVLKDPAPTVNTILLIGDGVVALALGAASIAAASVGEERYFFLRQSIAAFATMGAFVVTMLIDAAHAFGNAAQKQPAKKEQEFSTIKKKKDPNLTTSPSTRRQAPAPPQQQSRSRPKSVRGEILVALYDYEGQENDELNFAENDRIELLQDHEDGWAFGILLRNRSQGLFPINYTEKAR